VTIARSIVQPFNAGAQRLMVLSFKQFEPFKT
jgi:hypothetical protein